MHRPGKRGSAGMGSSEKVKGDLSQDNFMREIKVVDVS
jgi:hypothetical protein